MSFERPGPRLEAAAYLAPTPAVRQAVCRAFSRAVTVRSPPASVYAELHRRMEMFGALSRTTRPANAHSRMRPDLSRPGPSSILVAMSARARASAVLSVLGWMFVGVCVGAGLGFVVGAVFVVIQQRGETDPLAGEWSGLVVLIFQFWGGRGRRTPLRGCCHAQASVATFGAGSTSSSAASPALKQRSDPVP